MQLFQLCILYVSTSTCDRRQKVFLRREAVSRQGDDKIKGQDPIIFLIYLRDDTLNSTFFQNVKGLRTEVSSRAVRVGAKSVSSQYKESFLDWYALRTTLLYLEGTLSHEGYFWIAFQPDFLCYFLHPYFLSVLQPHHPQPSFLFRNHLPVKCT